MSEGTKNFILSAEIRKELEKGILVRQLKAQLHSMKGIISDKEFEIEELKRCTKVAHVAEIEYEKSEYFNECLRLKALLKDAKEELEREKQRREWSTKLAGGAGEEIRKEVAKLANGYQSILSNMSTKGRANRPSTSTGASNRAKMLIEDSSRPKRPQSASGKANQILFMGKNLPMDSANVDNDKVHPNLDIAAIDLTKINRVCSNHNTKID
jgi:hypothetical protein